MDTTTNLRRRRTTPRRTTIVLIALVLAFIASACDPGQDKPHARGHAAINTHVPERLRNAIDYRIVMIGGVTSTVRTDGTIELTNSQMTKSWDQARFIALHEFAHLVAFKYGTKSYFGAPPKGFPYTGKKAEEVWGDCFATALTGIVWPTYGQYPACPADSVKWTRNWVNFWFG